MSANDYENARAYIASRLEKVDTLDKLAEGISSPRRGNGWDPSKIVEAVVRVLPQSLDRLARKAIKPGISERIADMFRPIHAMSRIGGPATLIYLPLWYVSGFHECFYLRDASYRIRVDGDVVAVEVDGETRDLMIEESTIVPESLKRTLKRFAGLFTSEKRHFDLRDVTELAVKNSHAEMYVTADGHEGQVLEEVLRKKWGTQRIFDVSQLNVEGAVTRIASSKENKQTVIQRFQERLVSMPENPKHVLSSTFQIEELVEYYIPYIHFPVMRAGRIDHTILNAASAEIPEERTANFMTRQLSL